MVIWTVKLPLRHHFLKLSYMKSAAWWAYTVDEETLSHYLCERSTCSQLSRYIIHDAPSSNLMEFNTRANFMQTPSWYTQRSTMSLLYGLIAATCGQVPNHHPSTNLPSNSGRFYTKSSLLPTPHIKFGKPSSDY